jgi:hypothetical protein
MEPSESNSPATAASADAPKPGEPAPSAEPDGDVVLVGQQLAFYRALAEQAAGVAGWYLGARITLSNRKNPERLAQAAHSLRELMDKLDPVLRLPAEADGGGLGDRFAVMMAAWEKAKRQSSCHTDGAWSGEVDEAARRGFAAVDAAVEWQRKNRPQRKETYRKTIRALDVSGRPLPSWIEDTHVKQWNDLRDYFVKVCHHDRETDENEFSAALHTFEVFVLGRLKPPTFAEQATLDELIAEAEGGA